MKPSPATPGSKCPQCDKKLRVTEGIYERPFVPPYGRIKVGERPAVNRFAPFCSLRCGWRWAKAHIGRKKHG